MKTSNLLTLTVKDDSLASILTTLLSEFRAVKDKQHHDFSQLLNIQPRLQSELEVVSRSVAQVLHRVEECQSCIKSIKAKQQEFSSQMNQSQSKLTDFANYRKNTSRVIESVNKKIDEQKLNTLDLQKECNRISDATNRKSDKAQLQKAKKDIIQQVNVQAIFKKFKEIQQDIQQVKQANQKQKTLGQNTVQLQNNLIRLVRDQFQGRKGHSNRADSSQMNQGSEDLMLKSIVNEVHNEQLKNIVTELQMKVNRLIELEKQKVKQRSYKNELTRNFSDLKSSASEERFQEIDKSIRILKAKHLAIDQKLQFLTKHDNSFDEQLLLLNERIKGLNLNMLQERFKDLSSQIYNRFHEMGSRIQTKVDTSNFINLQSNLFNQLIKKEQEIVKKCDKSEVKKALFFIDNKIKELAKVVTFQQSQVQNAVASKGVMKCLSCQKQLLQGRSSSFYPRVERQRGAQLRKASLKLFK